MFDDAAPAERIVAGPIYFNANLSIASQVAYDPTACPALAEAKVRTVQEAIDKLCQHQHGAGCEVTVGKGGQFETLQGALNVLLEEGLPQLCLCLLPGENKVENLAIEPKRPPVHLKISGCGWDSRIVVDTQMAFTGFEAASFRDLAVVTVTGRLIFTHCSGGRVQELLRERRREEAGVDRSYRRKPPHNRRKPSRSAHCRRRASGRKGIPHVGGIISDPWTLRNLRRERLGKYRS